MERVTLKVLFGLTLVALVMHIVQAVRRPEKRYWAINNIVLIVAMLVFLFGQVVPLSPTGQTVTYVIVGLIMAGGFLKVIWDAKPWR